MLNNLPKGFLFFSLVLFFATNTYGQHMHEDVQNYHVRLSVSDSSNLIRVHETIVLLRESTEDSVLLDLADAMKVSSMKWNGTAVHFEHKNGLLSIPPKQNESLKTSIDLTYEGVPTDGLIIGKNKYNERTFFGDNWPNRAHNWIACNDHPSDKAIYAFTVKAPSKYKVVSNGAFNGFKEMGNGFNEWSFIILFLSPQVVTCFPRLSGVQEVVAQEDRRFAFFCLVNKAGTSVTGSGREK